MKEQQQIALEARKNPLLETSRLIRDSNEIPKSIAILFPTLYYFYVNGYLYFQYDEWGHNVLKEISKKDREVAKPFGLFFKRLYDLCKECHAQQDTSKIKVHHQNAYRWFAACTLELPFHDFEYLHKNGDMIAMWKERVRRMRSLEFTCKSYELPNHNPYLQSLLPTKTGKNLLILIEAAHMLAGINPNFEHKYWKPFIQAHREIIKVLETSDRLAQIKLLHPTQEYQSGSKEKSGKRGRYNKPEKL